MERNLVNTVCKASKLLAFLVVVGLVWGVQPAMATDLDLTAGGSGTINTAFFITVDQQSTGTGVIQSFVRVQATGDEEGYNADARPLMPDVNTSPTFTHDLQLGAVPIVTDPGPTGDYYEFLLDVNQTNANPLISLDELQIYIRNTPISDATTLASLAGSSTLVYDLDAGGDNAILLDYSLNSGSGSGDLKVYIPVSLFGGADPSTYVYLYSKFGETEGYETNDGFEEWAVRGESTPTVPEPTSLLLLGAGLVAIASSRSRLLRK